METLDQHTFVQGCLEYYEEAGLTPEPGWEKAHYPVPECLGGTDWVWLTKEHHHIHGVLQSIEYGTQCFYGTSKESLVGKWSYLLPYFNQYLGNHDKLDEHRTQENQSRRGRLGGIARSQLPDLKDHLFRMARISADRNRETNVERLRARNTGCFWWVNELGQTKKEAECPGDGWQRGRTWK